MEMDMGISMIGILIILAVGAALATGVVLVMVLLKGAARWWALGIGGGVVLLLLVLSGAVLSYRLVAERPAMLPRPSGQAARPIRVVPGQTVRPPAARQVATVSDGVFLANVYPSKRLAVEALAADAAKALETVTQPSAPPPAVRVVGEVPADLLEAAAKALRRKALVSTVSTQRGPAAAARPAGDRTVTCAVSIGPDPADLARVVLRGPAGEVSRAARVVEKDWAADPATYIAEHGGTWLVVRSPGPMATSHAADEAALSAAAARLASRVRQAIRRAVVTGRGRPPVELSVGELHTAILAELRGGTMVTDRFPVRYDRPYGRVWEQMVLVDASPQQVEALANRIGGRAVARRTREVGTWRRTIFSVAAVAALILVVYLVLNAATKGYYVWLLRIVAVVVVAGVAVVVALLLS